MTDREDRIAACNSGSADDYVAAHATSARDKDKNKDKDRRIEELESAISDVLKWRALDGDGISDPLRARLYELLD